MPESTPLSIMLVEDDQIQSGVLKKVITRFSGGEFEVTRCASIAQALEDLDKLEIHAVILDLELPDSSGLHTLNAICDPYPAVPIIIMTGTDNDSIALEALKLGAEDYIVKGRLDGLQLCRAIRHGIERKRTQQEMKNLQNMLQEERRLEALGAIASGIAHEINTPLQFIGTNLEFIKGVFDILEKILRETDDIPRIGRTSRDTCRKLRHMVTALTEERMMGLRREIPPSLDEAVEGIRRVKRIITAMNVFSRTAGPAKTPYDVNRAVRDALTITRHEWKHIAKTELYLDENLPPIPCYPEELSHCLLNLIVNACHAIEDVKKNGDSATQGVITISTMSNENDVEILVGDSGIGIPEDIQHRIFDPFFTTKAVGRGSGQGLSTLYQMIVRHMGGKVSFESYEGQGTLFKISLPITDTDLDTNTSTEKRERSSQHGDCN